MNIKWFHPFYNTPKHTAYTHKWGASKLKYTETHAHTAIQKWMRGNNKYLFVTAYFKGPSSALYDLIWEWERDAVTPLRSVK